MKQKYLNFSIKGLLSFFLILIGSVAMAVPANDLCSGATTLTSSTSNLAGTTVGTSATVHALGTSVSNYGVWYTWTGTGASTTISAYSDLDIAIVIAYGSCGSYTLVVNKDDNSSFDTESTTFTATNGITYYAYIAYYGSGGTSSEVNTFTISSTWSDPPSNDLCSGATTLTSSTSNLAGTTVGASATVHGLGTAVSDYGVWYTWTGNGSSTTISAYSVLDIAIVIAYGSCGSYTVVDNEDANGTSSTESTTFTATNGVTYYAYIAYYGSGGTSSEVNTFTISSTWTPTSLTWNGAVNTTWATAGNWVGGVAPISTNGIIIPDVANQPIITSNITVTSLTVNSGADITISSNALTVSGLIDLNGTLYISNATVDANGDFDATGGTIDFTHANGKLILSSTSTSLGTLDTGMGTVEYDKAGAQTVISDTYYNLTAAGSGAKTLGGNIIINNDMSFSGGILTQSTYNINVVGDWASTGGYFTPGTGTVTFDGVGSSYVSATTSNVTSTVYSDDCESSTGWTLNGGTQSWSLITPTGTRSPANDNSASGTKCFKSAAAASDQYFTESTYILTSPTYNLTGVTSSSLTFYMWLECELGEDGAFVQVYNGTTWVSATVSSAYDNTTCSFSATYPDEPAWATNQSSWIQRTVNISAYDNLATFKIRFIFSTDYFGAYGGFAIDDIAITGSSTFSGEAFNKLAFNKTSPDQVILASNILVNTQLTLTAGYHNLASYYLQLGSASSTAPILTYTAGGLYSATDNGSLKRYIPAGAVSSTATPFYGLFPFKKTATNLSVLELNSTSNITTGGFITATPKFASTVLDITDLAAGGGGGSTVTHVKSGKMIGMALTTIAGGTIDVKVSSGTFSAGTASDFTLVNYHTGVTATVLGTFVTQTASTTLPVITRTGVATANLAGGITVGTFNNGATPLPIAITSFTGYKSGIDNELNWTTASELNNDFFTIERTFDGSTFETIGSVNGAGNSTQFLDYSLMDYNVRPVINYYRLKQTDFDGKSTLSEIIAIDNTTNVISKEIIMKTNILGQEINDNYRGMVVIVYSDGSSVKVLQ